MNFNKFTYYLCLLRIDSRGEDKSHISAIYFFGGDRMTKIRNANGKLVCCVDERSKTVEIVHKGYKTILKFNSDGSLTVINQRPKS